jgi:hypothetical protein
MHLDCFHLAERDILIVNTRLRRSICRKCSDWERGRLARNERDSVYNLKKTPRGFAARFAANAPLSGAILHNCLEAAPPSYRAAAQKTKNATEFTIAFFRIRAPGWLFTGRGKGALIVSQ